MGKLTATGIIAMTIGLLLIGILLPIGLEDLTSFESYNVTIGTVTSTVGALNPTVGTLMAVVLPIIAVIGLILMYIPKSED